MRHPLLDVLLDAAAGRPPAPDCSVELLPPPPGPVDAVLSFTAHSYVAPHLEGPLPLNLEPRDDLATHPRVSVRVLLAAGYRPIASEVLLADAADGDS